jgi:hypothetical protein
MFIFNNLLIFLEFHKRPYIDESWHVSSLLNRLEHSPSGYIDWFFGERLD